jgi:hypothetical protein
VRSPLTDLLASLASALGSAGLRWYLFGAQAAILHGAARLSADVDVTVDLEDAAPARLVEVLEQAGFSVRVADPVALAEETRVIPFVHRETGIPVDAVLAGSELERRFLSRALRVRLGSLELPVASAEDMIAMKVLAGRAKDHEDAEAVARAAVALDLAYLRRTLTELEQALERADLLPELERILERVRRR